MFDAMLVWQESVHLSPPEAIKGAMLQNQEEILTLGLSQCSSSEREMKRGEASYCKIHSLNNPSRFIQSLIPMGQATSIHWDESHPNGKGPWDEIHPND